MTGKTSILQSLEFLARSGIQECLLTPNEEGRYTNFPVDPPYAISIGLLLADPSIGDQVIVLNSRSVLRKVEMVVKSV